MSGDELEFEKLRRDPAFLAIRRQFLLGAAAVTASAVTLPVRRARAGQIGQITAICSPNHSNLTGYVSCTGNHCEYYCQDATSNRWNSWTCSGQTFADCGWSSPSGCSVNASQRLCDALSACFTQSGSGSRATYSYQSSGNSNVSCWLACGLLNCNQQPSGWFYTSCPKFITTCQNVYNYKCSSTPDNTLCSILVSLCTANPASPINWSSKCLWANNG